MFAAAKALLRRYERGADLSGALARAGERIAAKYRADARSRSGFVPAVEVRLSGDALEVRAPEYSLEIGREKGQPAEWAAIVAEETRRTLAGGR